jgi:hypothetical protein
MPPASVASMDADTAPVLRPTYAPTPRSAIGGGIAVLGLWEVAAVTVNRALDQTVVPRPSTLVTRASSRAVLRWLSPPWLRVAGLLAAGAVIGFVGVHLPRRRGRARRRTHPDAGVVASRS